MPAADELRSRFTFWVAVGCSIAIIFAWWIAR